MCSRCCHTLSCYALASRSHPAWPSPECFCLRQLQCGQSTWPHIWRSGMRCFRMWGLKLLFSKPLTHISFRCGVPTPSVLRVAKLLCSNPTSSNLWAWCEAPIRTESVLLSGVRGENSRWPTRAYKGQSRLALQKCRSKGIRRLGIVLKHRSSLQRSMCPVVICLTYVALSTALHSGFYNGASDAGMEPRTPDKQDTPAPCARHQRDRCRVNATRTTARLLLVIIMISRIMIISLHVVYTIDWFMLFLFARGDVPATR